MQMQGRRREGERGEGDMVVGSWVWVCVLRCVAGEVVNKARDGKMKEREDRGTEEERDAILDARYPRHDALLRVRKI